MILRWLLLLLLFVLILSGTTLFYISTENGTRLIWNILTDKFPDTISAEKIEGSLGDTIQLADLNINVVDLNITAEQVEFSWQPAQLFNPELLIDQIKIHGLIINDKRVTTSSSEPVKLPDIELPLPIRIKSFLLTEAEYHSQALKEPLKIERTSFALHTDNSDKTHVKLEQFQAKMSGFGAELETKISGVLQARGDYPLDFDINWKATLPDQLEIKGKGKLYGDLEDLLIDQQLTEPARVDLNASLSMPLTDFSWAAKLQFDNLSLQQIKPDLPDLSIGSQLQGHGNLKQLQLSGDYTIASEEFGRWDGTLNVDQTHLNQMNIKTLTITSRDSGAQINLNGQINIADTPELDLRGNWQNLHWPFTEKPIVTTDQGEFQVTGKTDDYQLQLKTTINQTQVGDIDLDINGYGDTRHFVIEQLVGDLLSGQVNIQGEVNWGARPFTFNLDGDWKDIIWQQLNENNPQEITNQIKSPRGQFKLYGQPDKYVMNLDTALDGDLIPAGNWIISGKGTSTTFDLGSLHGDVLEGVVDLTGKLGWGEKLTWDMKLTSENINPGKLQKDWPGKLALSANLSGQQVGDPGSQTISATFEKTLIKGELRGYPFKAQTDLKLINNALDIKQFNISSGKSILKASGRAGKKLDLIWTLESPDLAELYPDAGGQLSAQGTIKGPQTKPFINATLNGKNIVAPGVKFGKIDSIIKLDLAQVENKSEGFDIQLNTSQVILGENLLDHLDIIGTGSLSAHTVKADLKSAKGDLHFLSKGGLKNDRWSGTIQELTLEEKKIGRWQLARPENLNASKRQADLEKLCLTQKQASLCLGGHWETSGAWRTNSDIDQLPLSVLGPFLPPDLILDGTFSSNLNASGTGSKNIRAKLHLNAPAGTIQLQNADDHPQFKYDKATLDIVMNEQGSIVSLLFYLVQPTDSPIKATLETPPFDPLTVDYKNLPLKGRLITKVDDLGFIQTFTHELEELKGSLNVDLRVAGTVGKPKIEGHTQLAADFFLPSAGIHLKDVKIDAISHDARTLVFTGQASSGEGKLDLKGTVGLAEDGFPVDAEITGVRFELIKLPEAWVLASPKLKIGHRNNKLNIEGEVTIPEAKLEPQGIASAVPISDDVIIINDPNDPEFAKQKKQRLQISTNVKVILGDKISLLSTGFSGSLKGDLLVIGKPKKPVRGSGEIIIYDGQFSAYGQELDIEKGRILFADGPIDSPNIDLKAIRKVRKVTAGIHATGPARSPELTLFSRPSMNQDDILSYLLIGRPLREASGSEGKLLIGAASSLGFKGGEMLTENIGQSLGLDEFSFGGEDAEDASLQIGKYLTPKLYISYGVGLFEPVTQLKLRYDFSRRWSMEAESGKNSGMDFLYKIEK